MFRKTSPQLTRNPSSSSSDESDDERGSSVDGEASNSRATTPATTPSSSPALPAAHHQAHGFPAGIPAINLAPTATATVVLYPSLPPITYGSQQSAVVHAAPSPPTLQSAIMDVLRSSESLQRFNDEHMASHPSPTPEQEFESERESEQEAESEQWSEEEQDF